MITPTKVGNKTSNPREEKILKVVKEVKKFSTMLEIFLPVYTIEYIEVYQLTMAIVIIESTQYTYHHH